MIALELAIVFECNIRDREPRRHHNIDNTVIFETRSAVANHSGVVRMTREIRSGF